MVIKDKVSWLLSTHKATTSSSQESLFGSWWPLGPSLTTVSPQVRSQPSWRKESASHSRPYAPSMSTWSWSSVSDCCGHPRGLTRTLALRVPGRAQKGVAVLSQKFETFDSLKKRCHILYSRPRGPEMSVNTLSQHSSGSTCLTHWALWPGMCPCLQANK